MLVECEECEVKAKARRMILGMKDEAAMREQPMDLQKSLTMKKSQEDIWRGMECDQQDELRNMRKAFRGGFTKINVDPDTI